MPASRKSTPFCRFSVMRVLSTNPFRLRGWRCGRRLWMRDPGPGVQAVHVLVNAIWRMDNALKYQAHRFSVAPMMDWTDRHCRFFHRLLTRRALLYTEMVTTGAVLHGDRARLLGFDPDEHPVALQLGGSDPRALAACAAHRRGLRLRRDQPQRRLPVRPRAGGPLRRLPDGGAGAGRRLRRRHAGRGARPGHGQVPHRHRRAGSGARARRVDAARSRPPAPTRSIVHARKAWLQGPVAQGEPRGAAARLRRASIGSRRRIPSSPIVLNGGIATRRGRRARISATSTA